jgi:hypothetical protein
LSELLPELEEDEPQSEPLLELPDEPQSLPELEDDPQSLPEPDEEPQSEPPEL